MSGSSRCRAQSRLGSSCCVARKLMGICWKLMPKTHQGLMAVAFQLLWTCVWKPIEAHGPYSTTAIRPMRPLESATCFPQADLFRVSVGSQRQICLEFLLALFFFGGLGGTSGWSLGGLWGISWSSLGGL